MHLTSESLNIDETVEFLVDTGASRTTLKASNRKNDSGRVNKNIKDTVPAGKRYNKSI